MEQNGLNHNQNKKQSPQGFRKTHRKAIVSEALFKDTASRIPELYLERDSATGCFL